MKKNMTSSIDSLAEPNNPILITTVTNLPKGVIKFSENTSKVSFEKRIILFHYYLVIIFVTLLLIYDLSYVLCEKFSPFFSYLVTLIKSLFS